jgi:hypothetical protein
MDELGSSGKSWNMAVMLVMLVKVMAAKVLRSGLNGGWETMLKLTM